MPRCRASGLRPSSSAFVSLITSDGGGAVVERARVAGGDRAVGAEHRLQTRRASPRWCRAGAVVLRRPRCRRAAVTGRDLAVEEKPAPGRRRPAAGSGRRTRPCSSRLTPSHRRWRRSRPVWPIGDVDVGDGRRRPWLEAPWGARAGTGLASANQRVVRPVSARGERSRSRPRRRRYTSPSPALIAWKAMRMRLWARRRAVAGDGDRRGRRAGPPGAPAQQRRCSRPRPDRAAPEWPITSSTDAGRRRAPSAARAPMMGPEVGGPELGHGGPSLSPADGRAGGGDDDSFGHGHLEVDGRVGTPVWPGRRARRPGRTGLPGAAGDRR